MSNLVLRRHFPSRPSPAKSAFIQPLPSQRGGDLGRIVSTPAANGLSSGSLASFAPSTNKLLSSAGDSAKLRCKCRSGCKPHTGAAYWSVTGATGLRKLTHTTLMTNLDELRRQRLSRRDAAIRSFLSSFSFENLAFQRLERDDHFLCVTVWVVQKPTFTVLSSFC